MSCGRPAERMQNMIYKSQQRAVAKYNKAHYKPLTLNLNIDKDADILSFLATLPPGEKAGFIKRAIRSYIESLSL